MSTIFLLLTGFALANMGFLFHKLNWWKKMFIFALGYPLFIVFGVFLEWLSTRQIYAKHWEFYVTTLCLYGLFTIPGVIVFILWPRELAKKNTIDHN